MSITIALVDDDRNILTRSIALQAEGSDAVYSDGETALKALTDNPPRLACSTSRCRAWTGWKLLRRLPRRASSGDLPDLEGRRARRGAGLAMGADDYIAKPFSQRC
jgi:two-component system response regulator ChvI